MDYGLDAFIDTIERPIKEKIAVAGAGRRAGRATGPHQVPAVKSQ